AAPTPPPTIEKVRAEFVADAAAFTKLKPEQVIDKCTVHNTGMKDEWEAWEKASPMTDERIKKFYKQTQNYIFDLGGWHLWDPNKFKSDYAFIDELRKRGVKTVLDFGGGAGFNSIPLAQAGFDVTLADLDSVTLQFAQFRAKRHNVKMSYWKS